MSACLVNITVTSYNRKDATQRCLESLKKTRGVTYSVTVVDNNSSDGSQQYLQEAHAKGEIQQLFLCSRNVGVARAANLGWDALDCPYYVKLDNDVELLREDWLSTLIAEAEKHPCIGTVGYYIDEAHPESAHGSSFAVRFCVGACILIPQHVHRQIGYWNEEYGLYGIEDSDFSSRIHIAGLENRYMAHSERYIRHVHQPYLNNAQLDDEIRVVHGVSDEYTAMFYFNNGLFMNGVRPLYVGRKFQSRQRSDGRYEFVPDRAYLEKESRYKAERDDFIRHYGEAVAQEAAAQAGKQ